MESIFDSYTQPGVFVLALHGQLLGNIRFFQKPGTENCIYRISDFIKALHLNKNFTISVMARHKRPGGRECYADWISIKSALRPVAWKLDGADGILDCDSHIDFIKNKQGSYLPGNKIYESLTLLPPEQLGQALADLPDCLHDFETWASVYAGGGFCGMRKPTSDDLSTMSVLDLLSLMAQCGARITSSKPTDGESEHNDNISKIEPDEPKHQLVKPVTVTADGRRITVSVQIDI